jgi:ribonuclease HI
MNITINTDASFCPITKASGYAFYIVCDEFKITKGGVFKKKPKNAELAEVMCIGNALATLLAQNTTTKVNYLIINTDCLNGIEHLKYRKGVYKQVRQLKRKAYDKFRVRRVELRHVRAHNGAPDARSWVNEWCDQEAKKWMRKQRNEINKKLKVLN